MSNLVQNQNQTFQTGILGQVTSDPQPRTFPCQIDPASTQPPAAMVAGAAVKLVSKAGPNIVVDVITDPTDGPVFGFICFNQRKNRYAAGDVTEIVGEGGVLLLKTSGAVTRGDWLGATNPTVSTNDPTVATDTTVGQFVGGQALGQDGTGGTLIKVIVRPGKITSTGVISLS